MSQCEFLMVISILSLFPAFLEIQLKKWDSESYIRILSIQQISEQMKCQEIDKNWILFFSSDSVDDVNRRRRLLFQFSRFKLLQLNEILHSAWEKWFEDFLPRATGSGVAR